MDEQLSLFGAEPLRITKPIRMIELFAGIGSQIQALKNLQKKGICKVPFETWRICEFDRFAVTSYNAVHGTDYTTSDITQIHASDLGIVDTEHFEYILTYSFPCTDLSTAGLQKGMSKGSGTRSGLLWEVERLLSEIVAGGGELPQILLCENVPQIVSKKNYNDFEGWVQFLSSIGYTSRWSIMNAKDYGIPQNRERFFMLSYLDSSKEYTFPKPRPLLLRLKDMLEKKVDEKFYLSDEAVQGLVRQMKKPHKPKILDVEDDETSPTITANIGEQTHWTPYVGDVSAERERERM